MNTKDALDEIYPDSTASDAVMSADHPCHEDGGPCHDCAFRPGSEANKSRHTVTLARLCVEGMTQFDCHVHAGMCRGWIAAMNLNGEPDTDLGRAKCEGAAIMAEILTDAIQAGVEADRQHLRN